MDDSTSNDESDYEEDDDDEFNLHNLVDNVYDLLPEANPIAPKMI